MYNIDAAHKLAISRNFLLVEDVDLIQKHVSLLRRDRVVEIADLGAGSGTTALSVLCIRSKDIRIITYDISQDNLNWARLAVKNIGCLDVWQCECCPSWTYPHRVDMLLIDADHSYEGVKKDLDAWLPFLEPGTPVWAHDYLHKDYPGVKQAIDECTELEMLETAGWGWMGLSR